MCDPTWATARIEDSETAYQETLPIALLPQRVARFNLGDAATTQYSKDGQLRKVTAMRFETACPSGWRYQLAGSERWYREGNLWTAVDWHEYQIEQSINHLGLQEWLNTIEERSLADRKRLDAELHKARFWYGNGS